MGSLGLKEQDVLQGDHHCKVKFASICASSEYCTSQFAIIRFFLSK